MSDTDPTPSDLERLCAYDTPTVCNALELVTPERRAIGFTTSNLIAADPGLKPICGYARTATIRAAMAPPPDAPPRQDYYEYVAKGPMPAIVVMHDLDGRQGFGAFWGEVNSNVHKGLGCAGVVTDGSMRDLGDLAKGFQILAQVVGPSHAHVHIVDFGRRVDVLGMSVDHGDIVHADRHGAVVVPKAAVVKIPDAVRLIQRREKVVLDAAKAPGFDFEKLKKAMAGMAEIH